jgi:hypothetical protein
MSLSLVIQTCDFLLLRKIRKLYLYQVIHTQTLEKRKTIIWYYGYR